MSGELIAMIAALLLPATLLLGTLVIIGLGLAGLATSDLEERRLIRG
jgi:hypothetical protein